MSEAAESINENGNDGAEDGGNVDIVDNNNDSQYTDVEVDAQSHGWKPDGVEGKRNVSAEEFMDKKSLFDRIHKLEKSAEQSGRVITDLKEHNSKIEINAYKQAISDLKSARKDAASRDDVERVVELSDQIENMQSAPPKQESSTDWDSAFNQFTSDNVWYGRIGNMTQEADRAGSLYAKQNPSATPEQVYGHVLAQVKTTFPDEFDTGKRERPGSVATPRQSSSKAKKSYSVKDLPEEHREMARRIISTGIKESDYVKQVLELG